MISVHDTGTVGALGELSRFRQEFYQSLTTRADSLFELTDAVLCADGPVTSLVELSLAAEHRRGHGTLYEGLNQGRIDIDRFRSVVARQSIPRCDDGRIVLAIDVSHWLRPDANTSPDRLFCHTYARGRGQAQMIPGWPYSFVAALEPGRTSWTAILDAQRLRPDDEDTAVAAAQLRVVMEQLIAAGHWQEGDPEIWIVGDSGYDGPRLAFLLADLPVRVLVRMRSDRVLVFPAPLRRAGTVGRGARHGAEFTFTDSRTWPEAAHATITQTTRYGTARAQSWDRLHAKLTHRGTWADHDGPLPILEGTVIRLQVDRLPGDGTPKPLWLWFSATAATTDEVDRLWQMFLRRFDLEHTFGVPQTNRGLDQASHPHTGRGRPVDVVDRDRAYPTPPGPSPRRRPAPSLGESSHHPRSADPGPRPPRVSQHPTRDRPAHQRTETLPARAKPPTRITQHPPRPRVPRREDHQNGHHEPANTLKLKLRACW
ncbi:MAG: transposase [Sciscionella sp.]